MTTKRHAQVFISLNFQYTILVRPVELAWRCVGDTDPSRSLRGNPTHTHTHTQIKSLAFDRFEGQWCDARVGKEAQQAARSSLSPTQTIATGVSVCLEREEASDQQLDTPRMHTPSRSSDGKLKT